MVILIELLPPHNNLRPYSSITQEYAGSIKEYMPTNQNKLCTGSLYSELSAIVTEPDHFNQSLTVSHVW